MMEGIDYLNFLNEFRAYDAKYLYDLLADNSSLMWLGNEKDVDYQTFFNTVALSNIGDFKEVYNYIELGLINEAIAANAAITPTEDIYVNLKTALSIYLNTWCKGNLSLTETEYNTLFAIANQTPEEGGEGVYTARVMINYNPDDYGVAFRLQQQTSIEIEDLSLFPNPANTEVYVNFENTGQSLNGLLKVYTLSGKLIMEHSFNTSNSFEIISVDKLLNGAYLFQLELSNFDKSYFKQKSGKLIIIKQ